ncbi:Odorant receptor 64, partial [Frankliniella occidentalis]
ILLIIRQVIEAFSSICGHVCLYTLLSYVLVIFASCSLLLREVGRVVKQTGKVGDAAAMHVQLVLGCSRMNAAFGVYLPHIAVAPSVIPLLSTVTIIMSAEKADMYVAGSFPAVLFYLAPLCEVGDMLVAGSDTFCFSAYCGPWLEEGPATRRCRWLLMSAPTMNLSAPGMVSVNRPTLRKAARTWFQFLQVLIKLKA